MSGPAPIPTVLKVLRGNPDKRKKNDKEPQLTAEIPTMPGNLRDAEARAEWKRMAELLDGVRILTRIDQKALALYCNTWSCYREAEKKLSKEGFYFISHNGSPVQNPAVTVMHTARKDMMKILSEFGMTPSSRTKVQVVPGGKKDDFEDFLSS